MAKVIQRTVPDRPQKVCLEGKADIEKIPAAPKLNHDVLGNFFSRIEILEERRGDPNERGVPSAEGCIVRPFVAGLDAPQELRVFHSRAKLNRALTSLVGVCSSCRVYTIYETPAASAKTATMSEPLPTPEQLSRFLAGKSAPLEEEAVRRWLAELDDRPVDVEAALRHVKDRTATSRPFTARFIALAAAAVVIMVAGAVVARRGSETPQPLTHRTAVGERDSLTLADGSRIVLGPNSSVVVTRREVELHGDAYFNVVHNEKEPFLVRAGRTTIRDIGTAFTVSSDSAMPVRVVVSEGIVEVKHASDSVTLRRGDVGTVTRDGQILAGRGVATPDDLAWMNGQLVFRDASLAEVTADLRRWYGVELRVSDSTLARRHFTGEFSGDPADRVLTVLALALGARVERRGDTAFVVPATSPK
jgi:transmembrane sensor